MVAAQLNGFELARLAGVASPDSLESPGAVWLQLVASSLDDWDLDIEYRDDAVHEIADTCVPVYTHERWTVLVDLAAYQEDISEYGPVEDLTAGAGVALYLVAERLVWALLAERDDSDDSGD